MLAAGGAAWAWILLALTLSARLAIAFAAADVVLDDRQMLRNILLLPIRDLIAPIVWAAGLMGNRIHWRDDVFDLKDGRLTLTKVSAGWKK